MSFSLVEPFEVIPRTLELIIIYEFSPDSCFENRVFKFSHLGSIGELSSESDLETAEPSAARAFSGFGGPGQSSPQRQKTGDANVTA